MRNFPLKYVMLVVPALKRWGRIVLLAAEVDVTGPIRVDALQAPALGIDQGFLGETGPVLEGRSAQTWVSGKLTSRTWRS